MKIAFERESYILCTCKEDWRKENEINLIYINIELIFNIAQVVLFLYFVTDCESIIVIYIVVELDLFIFRLEYEIQF